MTTYKNTLRTIATVAAVSMSCVFGVNAQAAQSPVGNTRGGVVAVAQPSLESAPTEAEVTRAQELLLGSQALMELFDVSNVDAVAATRAIGQQYGLAATREIVSNLENKHFEISTVKGEVSARVVDGPSSGLLQTQVEHAELALKQGRARYPENMPRCWRAWVAALGWIAASAAICVPFSGPAAILCAIPMGIIGMLPSFNNAC